MSDTMSDRNLVLVGGGHAMLPSLARAEEWARRGVAVTLIDAHPWLYYSGMVPEYLGGIYRENEVRIDLSRLCKRAGIDFHRGRATAIHPADRTVRTDDGREIDYDLLALNLGGSNPSPPGDVIATKPIYKIQDLARRVQQTLSDPSVSLRLAIAGGGAAGVEVALNLTARFISAGRARDLDLTLIEARPQILPAFPDGMRSEVRRRLRHRGVRVRTGTKVTRIEDGTVVTAGSAPPLPVDAVLWATGAVGPTLLQQSGLPTEERGFVRVSPTLRVSNHPRIFAAGDCAAVAGYEDLARVGVHAVKQGPVLRRNLDRSLRQMRLEGKPAAASDLTSFRPYPAAPLILSTGTPEGLWTTGSLWWSGTAALRLKHWIDRRWMRAYHPSWRNRPLRTYASAKAAASSHLPASSASPDRSPEATTPEPVGSR